jgi:hypothetical protein
LDEWELASYGSSKAVLIEALEFLCTAEFNWLKYLCSVGIGLQSMTGATIESLKKEGYLKANAFAASS